MKDNPYWKIMEVFEKAGRNEIAEFCLDMIRDDKAKIFLEKILEIPFQYEKAGNRESRSWERFLRT